MKANLIQTTIVCALMSLAAFGCASGAKKTDASAPQATATPAPQAAPAPAATSTAGLTCEKGADKRTIEIAPKGKGCEVRYTKNGKTDSVASSASGNDHCEKTREKMRGKLEASGYACK